MRWRIGMVLGVLAGALVGCASNPGGAQYRCLSNDGQFCSELVSGWTEADARSGCNTISSTFTSGASCPGGRVAHCTVTLASGSVYVTSFYAPLTVTYASMTCDAYAPAGSGATSDFAAP